MKKRLGRLPFHSTVSDRVRSIFHQVEGSAKLLIRRRRRLVTLQPRQRPLPGQVALHLREDDGQVQHRPAHGAVLVNGLTEADDFDLVLPQPAQQLQHLGQRPAQTIQRHHLHAVARLEGGLQAIQPRPVPRGPAATVLEDLPAVGQHPALRAEVVGLGIAGYRHAGVSI